MRAGGDTHAQRQTRPHTTVNNSRQVGLGPTIAPIHANRHTAHTIRCQQMRHSRTQQRAHTCVRAPARSSNPATRRSRTGTDPLDGLGGVLDRTAVVLQLQVTGRAVGCGGVRAHTDGRVTRPTIERPARVAAGARTQEDGDGGVQRLISKCHRCVHRLRVQINRGEEVAVCGAAGATHTRQSRRIRAADWATDACGGTGTATVPLNASLPRVFFASTNPRPSAGRRADIGGMIRSLRAGDPYPHACPPRGGFRGGGGSWRTPGNSFG